MVIGGFAQDSERKEVIEWIEQHIVVSSHENIDGFSAYAFGGIGWPPGW